MLARVWQLNERPDIRCIIGQSNSSFSMQAVIRERKILLVNLAGLGVENGRLTGSLLLNAVWGAVRAHAADPRQPTLLVLDEFQDFLNLPVDPETMLVRSRSYGLGMVLAHQHLEQLPSGLRGVCWPTPAARWSFNPQPTMLGSGARSFGRTVNDEDFMNLGQFEVLCRLVAGEGVSLLVSAATLPPYESTSRTAEALQASRGALWAGHG